MIRARAPRNRDSAAGLAKASTGSARPRPAFRGLRLRETSIPFPRQSHDGPRGPIASRTHAARRVGRAARLTYGEAPRDVVPALGGPADLVRLLPLVHICQRARDLGDSVEDRGVRGASGGSHGRRGADVSVPGDVFLRPRRPRRSWRRGSAASSREHSARAERLRPVEHGHGGAEYPCFANRAECIESSAQSVGEELAGARLPPLAETRWLLDASGESPTPSGASFFEVLAPRGARRSLARRVVCRIRALRTAGQRTTGSQVAEAPISPS